MRDAIREWLREAGDEFDMAAYLLKGRFFKGARPQFIKAAAISRAIAAHNRQTADRKNEGLEFPRALT